MRRALLSTMSVAVAAAVLTAAPAAHAEYPSPRLVSAFAAQQAFGSTTAVDLTADGRYVVWSSHAPNLIAQTRVGPPLETTEHETRAVGGIFRTDLQTGATDLVVPGFTRDDTVGVSPERPSVSADGRFVAFNVAGAYANQSEAYVRDMDTGAIELVSATDGGDVAMPNASITSAEAPRSWSRPRATRRPAR
jgi:hypothetical protein